MEKCTICGADVPFEATHCPNCGADVLGMGAEPHLPQAQRAPSVAGPAPPPASLPPSAPAAAVAPSGQHPATGPAPVRRPPVNIGAALKGTPYEPMTTWGFVGSLLLASIPVVGLVLTIIWACGGCRKISKRNWARATLIVALLGIVLGALFYFFLSGVLQNMLTGIRESLDTLLYEMGGV